MELNVWYIIRDCLAVIGGNGGIWLIVSGLWLLHVLETAPDEEYPGQYGKP